MKHKFKLPRSTYIALILCPGAGLFVGFHAHYHWQDTLQMVLLQGSNRGFHRGYGTVNRAYSIS